jgi:hypothetical protein
MDTDDRTTTGAEPTFRLENGRPRHTIDLDPDVTTGGATEIPDVTGLSIPEAARAFRAANLAVFPWRLVDGGKNLGAFVGKGYHQLAATITPEQAYELAALDTDVTGLGISAGRSGLVIFDVDRPELCPELLKRAILECNPPRQTTRDIEVVEGQVPRAHYIFRVPAGRRMGSPSKWQVAKGAETWGEVRSWNSGIAIGPGLHSKADQGGRYQWDQIGAIPELPYYCAETMPEFMNTADPATKAEMRRVRETMRRRTDPAAADRMVEKHSSDGSLSGRHGATLSLAVDLAKQMAAGRITLHDVEEKVHAFFYELVTDPARKQEPTKLVEWAVGQMLSDAAEGKVAGLSAHGVDTELPEDADVTEVDTRVDRVVELYGRFAGRPIGQADDIQRRRIVLGMASRRVLNSPVAHKMIEALDKDLIPLVLEREGMGALRAGSTEETAAAYHARSDALDEAITKAKAALGVHIDKEVAAYTDTDGVGAPLDRIRFAKWADITDQIIASSIARAYRVVVRGEDANTPNYDVVGSLPKDRAARVITEIGVVLHEHAERVAWAIAINGDPGKPLPQPPPASRIPIMLDSDALRIDGVNVFLNAWAEDPEDVAHNGDLFIYRGRPVLYTHRGGHMAERRKVAPITPCELISITNERADVTRVNPKTDMVEQSELQEIHAKVGLASVRRTLARTLTEVATTPILTPADTIVGDRTYDPDTGVLVACNVKHWVAPAEPSAKEIAKALVKLEDWYGDLAFITDGDRAAFWAYMFTVPIRRRLNGRSWLPVPALGVRTGKANAGKTLVSMAIANLHGHVPLRLPEGEEELHKRILSAYESNPAAQVLLLNNIPNKTVLDSAALAEVITEPEVGGRKLGYTGEDITHVNNKILVVNGNLWRPAEDLISRFVPCGLKPVLGADRRHFRTPDLEERMTDPDHHAQVLYALHVVLRGWITNGAQLGEHHDIRGNFRAWARLVDGILSFARIDGFGSNFSIFAELEENADEDFLTALVDWYGVEKWFDPDGAEKMLREVDKRDAEENDRERALVRTMPRDRSLSGGGTFSNPRKMPLAGRKLSSMLNQQIDLPINREGASTVALVKAKRDGVRGWKFAEV